MVKMPSLEFLFQAVNKQGVDVMSMWAGRWISKAHGPGGLHGAGCLPRRGENEVVARLCFIPPAQSALGTISAATSYVIHALTTPCLSCSSQNSRLIHPTAYLPAALGHLKAP